MSARRYNITQRCIDVCQEVLENTACYKYMSARRYNRTQRFIEGGIQHNEVFYRNMVLYCTVLYSVYKKILVSSIYKYNEIFVNISYEC